MNQYFLFKDWEAMVMLSHIRQTIFFQKIDHIYTVSWEISMEVANYFVFFFYTKGLTPLTLTFASDDILFALTTYH